MKNTKLSIVILAAGKGTRLGGTVPKPLTKLPDGNTIMGRQTQALTNVFNNKAKINLVVGYKAEEIIEAYPNFMPIYNPDYDTTNTSKSLLKALQAVPTKQGVLWLNGDVVFDEELMYYVSNKIQQNESFITVNTQSVSDEEVKYVTDDNGYITSLSKIVPLSKAQGEAVGINYVHPENVESLIYFLKKAPNDAYFEYAIEQSIRTHNTKYTTFDMSRLGLNAVEVDFAEDLRNAEKTFFTV